jgi:predicted TIM-barrel enzyme
LSPVTSYTVLQADAGKLVTNSGALSVVVTGLSAGQQIDFMQIATAQITFSAGSGVTLSSKDSRFKTAAQFSAATVKCVGTDTYVLIGDLGY